MTTTTRVQNPEVGEVYWLDLDPVIGSEQRGRRPALILSTHVLHDISGRVLVCPITSNTSAWPVKVVIPAGLPISGALLTDQIRMVDRSRLRRFIGKLPAETVSKVAHRLSAYVGVVPAAETAGE